jgi:ATP-dependent DNA helicase RecG
MEIANRSIMYLEGVGPKRAEILRKEANIVSFEDLLYYFPYKYVDRSRFYKVSEIDGKMPYVQLKGQIVSFDTVGEGKGKRLIGKFSDGSGTIELVWFQRLKYVTDTYKTGREYIIFGKPTLFAHNYNIVHPDIDPVENTSSPPSAGSAPVNHTTEQTKDTPLPPSTGVTPFYNTTERMKKAYLHSHAIRKMQFALLTRLAGQIPETLPPQVLSKIKMMSIAEAIRNIHFPESAEKLRQAQQRLKFDELFYVQLKILRTATLRRSRLEGIVFPTVGDTFNTFYRQYLPFDLTGAQKRVLREIRRDVGGGRQMNRLLQGDVGSGKTLVALMSMLLAVDNGRQACLMAPTEILANQHLTTIQAFLQDMDVRVALLTGSTTRKRRDTLLPDLAAGKIDILIGTHALIEETVVFRSLGLAVIDEQHRFGVEQRSRLWTKNRHVPHVLVMTATPIPRTLAMTLYGDLDVSVIDELPPGRQPVRTIHRFDGKQRAEVFDFLRRQIQEGRQVYVVYPLIEESKKLDYKNLEEGFETFCRVFPEYEVAMVHGKMKASEKEACMQRFVSGEAQVLVATTVIEVGVNVPNASVMVIESAERFGLSQLHQLRGRVGRGSEQSYCILISSCKLSAETRKRMEILVNSNDGFEIAEADLRLRGAGDPEGTQQSGEGIFLKIANLATDGQLLQYARDIAGDVLRDDPELGKPENTLLRTRLALLFRRKIDWGLIS